MCTELVGVGPLRQHFIILAIVYLLMIFLEMWLNFPIELLIPVLFRDELETIIWKTASGKEINLVLFQVEALVLFAVAFIQCIIYVDQMLQFS